MEENATTVALPAETVETLRAIQKAMVEDAKRRIDGMEVQVDANIRPPSFAWIIARALRAFPQSV